MSKEAEGAGGSVQFDDGSVMGRLLRSLGPFGFVAVDPGRVNMDDLLAPHREGRIVRVLGAPSECIQVYYSGQDETLGCVAGWISEDD